MVISWRNSALLLFLLALALFSSSFLEWRDSAIVPFSTASGSTGTVTLDLPRRVFTGDAVRLSARVAIDDSTNSHQPQALAGRLEASFEEMAPVGRVTVNLDSSAEVELVWRLRTGSQSVYPGRVWLWLLPGSGENLLLVREFEVNSTSYLGMEVGTIRVTAVLLAVLALLMAGFDALRRFRKR